MKTSQANKLFDSASQQSQKIFCNTFAIAKYFLLEIYIVTINSNYDKYKIYQKKDSNAENHLLQKPSAKKLRIIGIKVD